MAIEAAFFGTLSRPAELKQSSTGKPYLRIVGVRTGSAEDAQWVSVVVFDQDTIAIADRLVKNCRVYIEGRLSLDKWKNKSDGSGLSVMSWHCRLAQIGRNRTRKPAPTAAAPRLANTDSPAKPAPDFNDQLPGWTP